MTGEDRAYAAGWSAVLDAQPSGVVLLDAVGQVIRQNAAADVLQQQLLVAGQAWPWLRLQGQPTGAVVRAWVGGGRLEGRVLSEGAHQWWILSWSSHALPSISPTLVLASDGTILHANAAAQQLGVREGGENLLSWVDVDDQDELGDALVAPQGRRVAFFLRDRHGAHRYLTGSLLDRREDPDVGGLLLVCQEESRLYALEQRLRELERRFLRLLEGIPEAVVLASVRTDEHYVNHRARDLLDGVGVHAEGVLRWLRTGEGLRQFGTGEAYPTSRLPVHRALRGESCTVDDIEADINGTPAMLELSAAPIRDRGGGILYIIVTVRTITERRRLEQRLQQVSRMDAVGRMAGELAHDFRNFLTAIHLSGYQALEKLDLSHPARGELEEILSITHRAGALNRQILTMGRQQPMVLQRLSLNQFLMRSEALLARMLGHENELRLELEPDLWDVQADTGMMERVLINLTLNARDAMPNGGRLLISTENAILDAESVAGLGHPGPYVVVSVRDTGEGMTPEVAARIFEPFFTTRAQGKGTGLGLSMVYGVLRQQGGFVQVISAPGDGACFRVGLPRCASVEEPSTVLPAPTPYTTVSPSPSPEEILDPGEISTVQAPPGEGRLLLVDDEETIRTITARILRQLGYTVDTFSDAESAWEALRSAPGRHDLLLLDVDLPGMSGIQLAQQVLTTDPSARVLLISGREPDFLPESVQFLGKPFSPQALGEIIWRMLRTRP